MVIRRGRLEISATRIFNKSCAERVELLAGRTCSLMKVQEHFDCPEPSLFSSFITPGRLALFRPLNI
jgi:hypothetical protein